MNTIGNYRCNVCAFRSYSEAGLSTHWGKKHRGWVEFSLESDVFMTVSSSSAPMDWDAIIEQIKRMAPGTASAAIKRAALVLVSSGRLFMNDRWELSAKPYSKVLESDSNATDLIARNLSQMAEWTGLEPATPGVTGRSQNPTTTGEKQ